MFPSFAKKSSVGSISVSMKSDCISLIAKAWLVAIFILVIGTLGCERSTPATLSEQLDRQLIEAAASGNAALVKSLLEKGGNLDGRDKNGSTLLMFAANRGHMEVVKLLIEKGADVNAKTKGGAAGLMAAASMGHFEVVKFLIDKGADVNATNMVGETALSLVSAKKDRSDIVQYLKDHGAMFSISSVSAMAAEKKSEATGEKSRVSSTGKSRASFCKEVSKMIKDGTIDKYMPERQDPIARDPRGSEYLDLDIDGDGIPDKVTVSSGSESSYLVVQLSSGGEYDLDEGDFIMIVKIEEHIYALVTYWEWNIQPDGSRKGKKLGNRLYELTKNEAELICDTKDFERR